MTNLEQSARNFAKDSLASTLFDYIKSYGLNKKLIDIALCESGIYAILSDGAVVRVAMHHHQVEIKEYKQKGAPIFHLFGCKTLKEDEHNKRLGDYKVALKSKNSFHFVVREGNQELKVFHDVALDICPACRAMLEGESLNFTDFFSNVLDAEKAKKRRDIELLAIIYKRMKHFFCESCNRRFDVEDIEKLRLKFFKDSRFVANGVRLRAICRDCDSSA